jgi:hypothetical protein
MDPNGRHPLANPQNHYPSISITGAAQAHLGDHIGDIHHHHYTSTGGMKVHSS